jgi:hypothetical protein
MRRLPPSLVVFVFLIAACTALASTPATSLLRGGLNTRVG